MSTSYCVFVGPYIRFKKVKVDTKSQIRCCGGVTCRGYRSPVSDERKLFCADCGEKITTKEYTVKEDRFNHYDALAEYEDSLWSPETSGNENYHYLFPNHEGPRKFTVEPHWEQVEQNLASVNWESEVEWLKETYSDELKIIKAIVKDDLEICWGLVTYAH